MIPNPTTVLLTQPEFLQLPYGPIPFFLSLSCRFLFIFNLISGSMVGWQLRDGRRCQPSEIHSLRTLLAPLYGSQTGTSQCCFIWQTYPLRLPGLENPSTWHQVIIELFKSIFELFSKFDFLWKGKFKIPLLWNPGETDVFVEPNVGGR